MIKLRKKRQPDSSGFTLVEVITAILLITVFISVSMQAMVVSALMRVRSRDFTEATNWIQQDIENVRRQANRIGSTTLSSPISGGSLLPVNSTVGFAQNNRIQVFAASRASTHTITQVSGNTMSITPALSSSYPEETRVSLLASDSTNTTLCYSNSANNGFATLLNSALPVVDSETNNASTPNVGRRTRAGQTYTLTRTTNIRNVVPFSALQINYTVARGTEAPVQLTTEVIPNTFFQCPPF